MKLIDGRDVVWGMRSILFALVASWLAITLIVLFRRKHDRRRNNGFARPWQPSTLRDHRRGDRLGTDRRRDIYPRTKA